jgi:hypothetical protein
MRRQHPGLLGDAVFDSVSFEVFAGFCDILTDIENNSVFKIWY